MRKAVVAGRAMRETGKRVTGVEEKGEGLKEVGEREKGMTERAGREAVIWTVVGMVPAEEMAEMMNVSGLWAEEVTTKKNLGKNCDELTCQCMQCA